MDILIRISAFCINRANKLITIFSSYSKVSIFISAFLVVILWLVGGRLKKFAKPQLPKTSKIIRDVADVADWIGLCLMVLFGIYITILLFLTEIGFYLSNASVVLDLSILKNGASALWGATRNMFTPLLIGGSLGLFVSLIFNLKIIPDYQRGEGLHHVKDLIKKYTKLKRFDPRSFFDSEKGCFVGLDLKKNPIYIAWIKLCESHIQILGTSGTGKGIMMTVIGSQCAALGQAVIWFDPKLDTYSPGIMEAEAKRNGKEFHYINLNMDQPPQFNLLANASADEIEELFVSGFDLKGIGTDGDFYKNKDESAAIESSKLASNYKSISILQLFNLCSQVDSISTQENFWNKFKKFKDLEVINTLNGINLTDAFNKGSVIYIVGSTGNDRVIMLQKMLLVRIIQIIRKQDRYKNKIINKCLILDEFKYILSPAALTSLSTIRNYDTHLIIGHQSMGDLDSCANITKNEAEGAVVGNTAIKIIYKIGDYKHAEELSKNSGKIPVFVEQTSKSLDKSNMEEGGWRETHVQLIDADEFMHLPMATDRKNQVSAGVLFGVEEAKVFYIDFIKAKKRELVPKAALKSCNEISLSAADQI